METRGQRIARLRESKGWSPYDLQMESGVREQNIRNYESGRRNANDADILKALADALGVSVDYLVEASSESNTPNHSGEHVADVDDIGHAPTVAAAKS